jgi:glucosyl-3-phosphoglycerate synthase
MDFHQNSIIKTYHMMDDSPDARAKTREELRDYGEGIALVLPSLYSEIEGEGLPIIRERLEDLDYLSQLVVVLDGPSDRKQFDEFREYFSGLPGDPKIVWTNGKRIKKLCESLKSKELDMTHPGKGRAVHLGNGYIISTGKSNVIASHDCDIITYDSSIVDRLVYPIAILGDEFCKGFYSRHAGGNIYGRVVRLFIIPLLRALKKVDNIKKNDGAMEFLKYMEDFRYPLAGDVAMRRRLARSIRRLYDWSLEVGDLAEVYKNCSLDKICQSGLLNVGYEHKHQELSPEDRDRGLHRMSREIGKSLIRNLARQHGVTFTEDLFITLEQLYLEEARDLVNVYEGEARINGFDYNRHEENQIVTTFAESLVEAKSEYTEHLESDPTLPSWERIVSADPDFLKKMLDAVEKDNIHRSMI